MKLLVTITGVEYKHHIDHDDDDDDDDPRVATIITL